MKYLKDTVRWIGDQPASTAVFATSTWTLACCWYSGAHSGGVSTLPAVLFFGVYSLARAADRRSRRPGRRGKPDDAA
jgi:hypothetical protein